MWTGQAISAAARVEPQMRRYLPLAILATGMVVVLPAILVNADLRHGSVGMTILSAAVAVVVSLVLAALGAALWKRRPRSRDLVFAELMLWCWARRCWTERRLSQARELFESARKAGPLVNIELLLGLSRLLEARDAYVHGHSQRVARHSVRIARAMGLSPREIAKIRTAAEIHDVGKLYTPREILNSPYPLDEGEFAVVKQHASQGAEMVSVVGDPEITAMVRHHHERIDGGGYPDGLAGAAIPLGARIVAVGDTFDAITSDRAYRSAGSQKRALEALSASAGTQLDADAVASFLQVYSARRSVAWYAAGTVVLQRAALALQSLGSHLSVGSVGALVPALGAAGVLAASPGLFEKPASRPSTSSATRADSSTLLQQFPGSAAVLPGGGKGSRGARGPRARIEPLGAPGSGASGRATGTRSGPSSSGVPSIAGSPNGSDAAGATTGASNGGGASGAGATTPPGSSSGSPVPRPGGALPVGGVTRTPSQPMPSVTVPSVTTPSVSTPSVSTPTISTPSIETPSVSAAGVTVPSVHVPSVTIPGVTVPGVTVAPVKLPSLKLGG